jgi:hypothetical protein
VRCGFSSTPASKLAGDPGLEEKPRPKFPVRLGGVDELHAAFLTESCTRDSFWSCEQEIWGSEAVALSAPEVKMLSCAAAENQ